jgi:hypothetical protein
VSFDAGDAFRAADSAVDAHLWFVISEPRLDPREVLIVNFTTWKEGCDPACIVEPGEHPFVRHRTYVRYRAAQSRSLAQLAALLIKNLLVREEPASPELLARMRHGAGISRFIKIGRRELLRAQGLI